MSKYKHIVVIFFLLSITCLANSEIDGIIKIEEQTSWADIAKKYKAKGPHIYTDNESYEKALISWNKHIKTKSPMKGDQVYTISPYSPFLQWDHAPALEKESSTSNLYNLISYYSASHAQNKETLSSNKSITYKLNSPITLGLQARRFLNSSHSISSSAYFSYITTNDVIGSNTKKADIPLEFGAEFYHELATQISWNLKLYYGLDFDQFSSIDQQSINDDTLKFDTNQLIYLTAGTSYDTEKFFTKFSISQSIYSNASAQSKYSGYKSSLFIGRNISKNFSMLGFTKYIDMKKDSGEYSGLQVGLQLRVKHI